MSSISLAVLLRAAAQIEERETHLEHGQREQVRSGRHLSSELVNLLRERLPVLDVSVDVRVLDEHSTQVLGDLFVLEELVGVADEDVDVEALGSHADDRERLGEDARGDDVRLLVLDRTHRHDHG